jgi:stage II sporulation protein D
MKKIIFLLSLFLLYTLLPVTAAAQEDLRIGLYYDAVLRTHAVLLSAEMISAEGFAVSIQTADPVNLSLTYSVAVFTPVSPAPSLVQIVAVQTATEAVQSARSAKNIGYKAYMVYRSDGTAYPYKVWVEGIEAAVKVHYHSAFTANTQGQLLFLTDKNQAEIGLVIDGRVPLLLKPLGRLTRVGASGQFTRNYEGSFELMVSGGKIAVVNILGIEPYVFGVVPYEMSDYWPVEALKAQAVAARSYAFVNKTKHRALGFGLCDSPACCQKYAGFNGDYINARLAVEETAGMLARHSGKVAQLYYHSNSGGYTENSEEVWSNALPYVRATPDPYSINDTLLLYLVSRANNNTEFPAKWVRSHSRQDVEEMLRTSMGIDVGTLLEIRSVSKSEGGRHLEIMVRGTAGEFSVVRGQTRSAFSLPSSLYNIIPVHQRVHVISADSSVKEINVSDNMYFATTSGSVKTSPAAQNIVLSNGGKTRTVTKVPSGFSFDGRGWGHGVGMSQWGAYEMAKQGYTYQEILTYYFRGISIN